MWDGRSYGLQRETVRDLLREADAFINICGAQLLTDDHMQCPRRIFLETDPVAVQLRLSEHDPATIKVLEGHTTLFTFGENLGTPHCPLPTGDFTWHPTRQPVMLDMWRCGPPPQGAPYTTIGNWQVKGKDIVFNGTTYHWQKSLEFLKFRELPGNTRVPFQLAMNFDNMSDRAAMEAYLWRTRSALKISREVDTYRAFIQASRGEFTVAKEQNIVFQTGWFSDRAATYLAAGRPVLNQDTGFHWNLPTGVGAVFVP